MLAPAADDHQRINGAYGNDDGSERPGGRVRERCGDAGTLADPARPALRGACASVVGRTGRPPAGPLSASGNEAPAIR